MKKLIISLFTAVTVAFLSVLPAFAEKSPRLVDDADLLTYSEEISLAQKLDEISERQNFDVVIVTVDSLQGKSVAAYADDFYDYGGYRYDGALLLVSMEFNDWYVSTKGFGITAITGDGLDYMSDEFVPYLSDGEYAAAFESYASLCDDFVTRAKSGDPYDRSNLPKGSFPLLPRLGISVLIGFIIAFITVSVMKSGMKSVRRQPAANSYVKQGSMHITESSDLFLYTKTDRRPRPKDNGGSDTHISSSGSVHGGGGGKF